MKHLSPTETGFLAEIKTETDLQMVGRTISAQGNPVLSIHYI